MEIVLNERKENPVPSSGQEVYSRVKLVGLFCGKGALDLGDAIVSTIREC